MKIKFLLIGTSLSLIPQFALAQCAETDCLKLGYNKLQKCDNGLKCPFGEYWACPQVTKANLGSCNGYAKNCKIGDILNSDGTCTEDKVGGKTPIGVVIYISAGTDKCGYAMTLSPVAKDIAWGDYHVNVPKLPDYPDWESAHKDYNACSNTKVIIEFSNGDASKYPVAWAAVNYVPSVAPETKGKWCLPSAGVLHTLFINLDTINNTRAKLGESAIYRQGIWSSSESNIEYAWSFYPSYYINDDGIVPGIDEDSKYEKNNYVYPVILF